MKYLLKIIVFSLLFFSCKVEKEAKISLQKIEYSGGNGLSIDSPVLIKKIQSLDEITLAEENFLIDKYNIHKECEIVEHTYLLKKKIDVFKLKYLNSDSAFNVYFDMKYIRIQ